MAINGLLGYVPYYSLDGVEVMRIPVISVSGTYPLVGWEHTNASSQLIDVSFKHSASAIHGFITKFGELHIKGTDELYFRFFTYDPEKIMTTGTSMGNSDSEFPVVIFSITNGAYEPGSYNSADDTLIVLNSTASRFEFDIELVDTPEPSAISPIDPQAYLMGFRVGQLLRGMR